MKVEEFKLRMLVLGFVLLQDNTHSISWEKYGIEFSLTILKSEFADDSKYSMNLFSSDSRLLIAVFKGDLKAIIKKVSERYG